MRRPFRTALVWSLVSIGGAATAWAHHSFAAAFDMNKPVTVQGTIVQVRLENPHSWFFLDVKDAERQSRAMGLRGRNAERHGSQRLQARAHQEGR